MSNCPLHVLTRLAFGLALLAGAFALPVAADSDTEADEASVVTGPQGRREPKGDPVILAFNSRTIDEILDFIVETTGKTVVVGPNVSNVRVTVVNDVPLPRNEALNLIFEAFLETTGGVAVIETEDRILLEQLANIGQHTLPVIPADESVAGRTDRASFVNKVFSLSYGDASEIQDVLEITLPDWASIEIEEGSNQLVVRGTIGFAQQIEQLVEALDRPRPAVTMTFRLQHANATAIEENILALYSESGSSSSGGRSSSGRQPSRVNIPGRSSSQGGGRSGGSGAGQTELRVTTNLQQNSVTVVGDPDVVEEIERRISDEWDIPFDEDSRIVEIYTLRYRDVIVVRDILDELLSGGGTGGGGVPGRGGGGGGSEAPDQRVTDQFAFQADPSANQLIVIGRTSQGFTLLDKIIADLDTPGASDLPEHIELKHADAQELAEVINVLLAPENVQVSFEGQDDGLTTFDTSGTIAEGATGGAADDGGGNAIEFPWQRARERDDQAPVSHLIGKVRIMPVFRQNAVLVLGPPHYKEQIRKIIDKLDKPGRQVLITAVIAEVELNDALSLGLRVSSGAITGSPIDNTLGGTSTLTGTQNDILSRLFDTSVLEAAMDINVVLEALKTTSNVRILSEPRIFTADNTQANFFDGQNVQFLENSVVSDQGGVTNSFEFQRVGIVLSVRPRITVERDIDLLVSLELSSLAPSATTQGGAIIDTRITTTRVVVKDSQTIVISGIIQERESDVKRKVPFFGDIPILGALFTSTSKESVRSELLAFITPIVIDNPEDNFDANEANLERLELLKQSLEEVTKDPEWLNDVRKTREQSGQDGEG